MKTRSWARLVASGIIVSPFLMMFAVLLPYTVVFCLSKDAVQIPQTPGHLVYWGALSLYALGITLYMLYLNMRAQGDLSLLKTSLAIVFYLFLGELALILALDPLCASPIYKYTLYFSFPSIAIVIGALSARYFIGRVCLFFVLGIIIFFLMKGESGSSQMAIGVYALTVLGLSVIHIIRYKFFPKPKFDDAPNDETELTHGAPSA